MPPIRVLVIEDSLTVRKRLIEILRADPDFDVVGEGDDGKACVEMCRQLRPNVVVLDMVMPVMSGLAATEYIMAYFPTPILIVSASANRGELFKTYDALAAGALDVLEKPRSDEIDDGWERMFVSRVKLISKIRVITHLKGRRNYSAGGSKRMAASGPLSPHRSADYRVIAIGTSTGGPAAIAEILRNLPGDFPIPILLVMHIGESLGMYLADWIDSQSALRVAYATDGEPISAVAPGHVLMAPANRHLLVHGGRLRLTRDSERHSCRPSVDVLFESLADELGEHTIACLLTGMGKDGAAGLLAIRQAGGFTIAQDEATSIVFGMPQEAIRLWAAERVLGLTEIAPALLALANHRLRADARSASPGKGEEHEASSSDCRR